MRLHVFVGAVAAALVIGCGGGAPDLDDTTPPTVVSTTPAAAAPDVSITAPIVVRFSESIQSTFSVALYAGDVEVPLPAEDVELRDGARELRITPPRALALPATMRLAIAGVVDRFDNPLSGGDVDLRWTYPAWIRLGPVSGAYPVGSGCGGNGAPPFVTTGHPPYVGSHYGSYGTFCAARWTGTAWSPLPDPSLGSSVAAGFVSDPTGALVACYCTSAGPCHVKRFTNGSWQDLGGPSVAGRVCTPAYLHGELYVLVRYPSGTQEAYQLYGRGTQAGSWYADGDAILLTSAPSIDAVAWSPILDTFGGPTGGVGVVIGRTTGSPTLYHRRFGTARWATAGTGFVGLGTGSAGLLAVSNGALRQYDGQTWTTLGVISNADQLFAAGGVQPLALKRTAVGYTVSAFEWDGQVWRNLGVEQTAGPVPTDIAGDADGRVFFSIGSVVYQFNR